MRRLVAAALLLYPRSVRRHHGAELECLVEELIERDGAWRPAVLSRLAADGLAQRLRSRSTAWVAAATLALTSLGGLAVSDFSAASARQRVAVRARPVSGSHATRRASASRAPGPGTRAPRRAGRAARMHQK